MTNSFQFISIHGFIGALSLISATPSAEGPFSIDKGGLVFLSVVGFKTIAKLFAAPTSPPPLSGTPPH